MVDLSIVFGVFTRPGTLIDLSASPVAPKCLVDTGGAGDIDATRPT